jgi:O-antigen ligase/tetratricopeptide (TPR) repeat protein
MYAQVSADHVANGHFGVSDEPSTTTIVGQLTAVARIALLAVICAAPWWFGGIELQVQYWLYVGILISLAFWLAACCLQSLSDGVPAISLPTVLVPVIAALLLGALQLWPTNLSLPGSDAAVAPSDSLPHDQTGEMSASTARTLTATRPAVRSIYPFATRVELARLVMALIALFLGSVLFSSAGSQFWLWTCLALNGAALAFFGIAQQLNWNGKLFGTVPLTQGGQPFASYVNRNNAAGYLNLCLAAAWGLVFWWLIRARQERWGRQGDQRWQNEVRVNSFARKIQRAFDGARSLDGRQIAAVAVLTLIATGIVCSLSRGGGLAMLVATLAVCSLMARTRSGLRMVALLLGIGLLCAGLMFWTGLTNRVGSRWEVVSRETLAQDARLANWSAALGSARDFPVTGTGFGTYRFAYLPYQTWSATVRFDNADNQFVEGLVEGGLVGLGLILLAILLSLAACLALARAVPADPVAVVGLFAVISQCVSASFDFGPTLAANMLTFALMIGAVTGRAAKQFQTGFVSWCLSLPVLRPAWLIVLVGAALLAHGTFGLSQLSAAADSQIVQRDLPSLDSAASMPEASLAAAIDQLEAVTAGQTDDAEAHQALAKLWIYRYRIQVSNALAEQSRAGANWRKTDPAVLYVQIHEWIRDGERERVEALCALPPIRDNLLPAWKHLTAAQAACPLMPGVDLQLATLAFVENPGEPTGEEHLRRAVLVSPGDPDRMVRCGSLAQAAGLTEFAYACWRRSLELDPDRLGKIRRLWTAGVTLEEELNRILPESPELLLSLAEASYAGDENRANREILIKKAEELIASEPGRFTESSRLRTLARCNVLRDNPAAAADYYQQLLSLEPLQVAWRLELVRLLRQQGNHRAALDQAELCLAMAPDQKAVRDQVSALRHLTIQQSTASTGIADPPDSP